MCPQGSRQILFPTNNQFVGRSESYAFPQHRATILYVLRPKTGTDLETTDPNPTLYKETCGIERLAPERRVPHPASEEGKLELTEALRSFDRS